MLVIEENESLKEIRRQLEIANRLKVIEIRTNIAPKGTISIDRVMKALNDIQMEIGDK